MIPDDVEALALADAVGALDAAERRELEARVDALSPEQQAEVARLYDVSLAMAAAAPDVAPPDRVRTQLMALIAADGIGGDAVGDAAGEAVRAATPPARPANYTLLASEGQWNETPFPGITMKILAIEPARNLVTMLLKGEPGARYPSHRHSTGEECYVISGSVVIEGRLLRAGDFHHAEADSDHGEISTTEGTEVLLIGAVSDYLPDYPL
jgi:quercetin dioxygenase-like cupin family protein